MSNQAKAMTAYRTIVAAGFVLAVTAFPPQRIFGPAFAEPQAAAPKPAQIDKNGTLILVRSSLIALQQANETGNYTVLRDLGAPGFQQANDAVRLGEIFANLRGQRLDLSGVAVLEPQLTLLPQIEPNGLMHMAGFFPSVPTQINFELLYAPVESRWRLFGISVKLASSAPVAPSLSPPAAKPASANVSAKKKPEAAKLRHKKKEATADGFGEP